MKLKQILLSIALIFITFGALGEEMYKVTGAQLNIRKSAGTKSSIIGSLKSGQEVEVISISNGWANIRYKGKTGYVSAKYLKKVSTSNPSPSRDIVREVVPEDQPTSRDAYAYGYSSSDSSVRKSEKADDSEIETLFTIGSFVPRRKSFYLAAQIGMGGSDFTWDVGKVNGTFAFEFNILAQLYFESKASFIPRNWYWDASLGYKKLGAAGFAMHYIHLGLTPFGYRIPINPVNILVKAGLDLSVPCNSLETSSKSWSANFEVGMIGGVEVEWKQWGAGVNVLYDFNEVSSASPQTLHNYAIMGVVTYKFGKFGRR